jgi:hypothetical protein
MLMLLKVSVHLLLLLLLVHVIRFLAGATAASGDECAIEVSFADSFVVIAIEHLSSSTWSRLPLSSSRNKCWLLA